jgi:sugar phosphate isomerase/epimerase
VKLSYMVATPEVRTMPAAWVGDPAAVLGEIAEIGYGGVELQTRDPRSFDTAAFLAQTAKAGLVITGVSTAPAVDEDKLYLTSPDETIRQEAVRRLTVAVELAAEYGTHATIGRIRGQAAWAPTRETAFTWLRAGLSQVVERAAALGVRVVLEPQGRPGDMFTTMRSALSFLEDFGSDVMAVEADSYHMALEERSIPAALVTAHRSGRLVHVQVSDTNRLAPGWGHLNWMDFFDTLRALNYGGWVCIEARQDPDSRSVARQAFRFVELIATERAGDSDGTD